ncbi:hypothetical protein TNCV_2990101 [Trichonephila clavipes]|nr:hypothetical protein TNCV_2990101 [Trichonephila clavipes]
MINTRRRKTLLLMGGRELSMVLDFVPGFLEICVYESPLTGCGDIPSVGGKIQETANSSAPGFLGDEVWNKKEPTRILDRGALPDLQTSNAGTPPDHRASPCPLPSSLLLSQAKFLFLFIDLLVL